MDEQQYDSPMTSAFFFPMCMYRSVSPYTTSVTNFSTFALFATAFALVTHLIWFDIWLIYCIRTFVLISLIIFNEKFAKNCGTQLFRSWTQNDALHRKNLSIWSWPRFMPDYFIDADKMTLDKNGLGGPPMVNSIRLWFLLFILWVNVSSYWDLFLLDADSRYLFLFLRYSIVLIQQNYFVLFIFK